MTGHQPSPDSVGARRQADRAGHEPSRVAPSRPDGDHPSRWTPGPWELALEPALTSRGFCRIVGSKARPNRANLAHVMGLYVDRGSEADANARLIAAAPELYEALQEIRDFSSLSNATAARIDAVLAKARGEAA